MFARLVALALVGAFAPLASAASPKDATFYIQVDRGAGFGAAGTGTVIASEDGRSLVLTNSHVVKDAVAVKLVKTDANGKPWEYKATVLDSIGAAGVYPDLALIETRHDLPAVEIADELPAVGSSVTTWGYGPSHQADTWEPFERTGKVVSSSRYASPWFVSTLHIIEGDSGCGVFDAMGCLVGCNSLGYLPSMGANVASIHSFTVASLKKHKRFQKFHDRLAARKIMKALPILQPKAEPPPAVVPPQAFAPSCPNGQCAPQSQKRGLLGRRR